MSTLFASLRNASSALDVLEQAMGVVQNNVTNASTPGYVTQSLNLEAAAFDPANGLWGGIDAGDLQSARSAYAESAVWTASEQAGASTQQASSLNQLQSLFDVSGTSGIPGALSALYSAFSAWSTTPTDMTARQQVISAAQQVTQAFNNAASGVGQLETQTDNQLQSTVSQINSLTSQIAQINGKIRGSATPDAGVDAQLYNTLEQLSNLAPISVLKQSDGTVSVLMGGQVPLVLGQTQTQLQVSYSTPTNSVNPNAPPDAHILTSDGQDVTSTVGQGQLGGLLQFRNVTLPSVIGNGQQQGSLNQLAQAIADRVNGLLTAGQISTGVQGSPLFAYSASSPTGVAGSMALDPNITASTLAAIDPGPPVVANGVADHLAQLANPQSAADMIKGMSYTDFYSSVASDIGTQEQSASAAQQAQSSALTQAQNLRSQLSGVSLNDQATQLLQFQQAFQASSQAISTISSTLQYLMQAMQQVQ